MHTHFVMPADSIETTAEQAALQHALSRGFIDHTQLQEALKLRDASRERGQPANLVAILSTRFLQPPQAQEVHQVYQRKLQDRSGESGPGKTVHLPPRVDPAAQSRARKGSDRHPSGDPFSSLRPHDPEATQVESPTQSGVDMSENGLTRTIKRQPGSSDSGVLETIGGYRIVRELARGGMGVVYVGEKPGLDRKVAIKVLLNAELAADEDVERFKIEAQATARLQHPGIVTVYDVGEERGRPYIVMELVEGESLKAKLLREGPLPGKVAARLMQKLAKAMSYAHAHSILHRDLKPSNVLLDLEGEPKITDFGLAKDLTKSDSGERGLTLTGDVMGTPAYMPPEQATGELDQIDRRSDVYSLGATLYEMLTRRPPFEGANAMRILSAVMVEDPPTPSMLRPGIDKDLETICLKCLEKRPDDRYLTAKALAMDLGRFLKLIPIAARPPTLNERFEKWLRRNRGASWVIAGTLLLLGVSATGVLLVQHDARAGFLEQASARSAGAETALSDSRAGDPARLGLALKWFQEAYALDMLVNGSPGALSPKAGDEQRAARAKAHQATLALASAAGHLGQLHLTLQAYRTYADLPDAERLLRGARAAQTFDKHAELAGAAVLDPDQWTRAVDVACAALAEFPAAETIPLVLARLDKLTKSTRAVRNHTLVSLARDAEDVDDKIVSRLLAHDVDERPVGERLLELQPQAAKELRPVTVQFLGMVEPTSRIGHSDFDAGQQVALLCLSLARRAPDLSEQLGSAVRDAALEFAEAYWSADEARGAAASRLRAELRLVLTRFGGLDLFERAIEARRDSTFLGFDSTPSPPAPRDPPPFRDPDSFEDLLRQLDAALEAGRWEEALPLNDRALEQEPDDVTLWLDRIEILAMLRRPQEALEACDRAIQLAPQEPAPWKRRAVTLANLGRKPEALQDLKHVLELDPQDLHAISTAGFLLLDVGRPNDAREMLLEFHRLAGPDDPRRPQVEQILRDLGQR